MNVIFSDIDGTLNCCETRYSNIEYEKNNPGSYVVDIDEDKVRILADICKETDSKLVISSAWRKGWLDESGPTKQAIEAEKKFNKYGLKIYGFTPCISKKTGEITEVSEWREYDINAYLISHPEIDSFCIIDDEKYDLSSFENHLVLTSDYINDKGEYGLLERHKEEVKEKLKEKRIRYSDMDAEEESIFIKLLLSSALFEESVLYELNIRKNAGRVFYNGMIDAADGKRTIKGSVVNVAGVYNMRIDVYNDKKYEFQVMDDFKPVKDKLFRYSCFSDDNVMRKEELDFDPQLILKRKKRLI